MADKLRDGTHTSGTNHHLAKLTDEDVAEIRRRHSLGGVTQKRLADDFGCDPSLISRIVNNKSRS